ncbi:MAG: hypothetical protein EXS37_17550 [Opitutus sp.]|nr:hypothetical protein [Opitutus sp.]
MKTWCALSALLLAVVCGTNLIHVVRRTPPLPRFPTGVAANAAVRNEQRFAALRRALPTHGVRGTIGYVADLPPAQLAADAHGMAEYFLAQFTLAPWVLDARLTEGRWAVANLHAAHPTERMPAGFSLVEDFGDGVLLLQKGAP